MEEVSGYGRVLGQCRKCFPGRAYPGRVFLGGPNLRGFFQKGGIGERFFGCIAFWLSCPVSPDLGEVYARRSEFGRVFPEGRNPEGGTLGRRNPGRISPEDRIRYGFSKRVQITNYPKEIVSVPLSLRPAVSQTKGIDTQTEYPVE